VIVNGSIFVVSLAFDGTSSDVFMLLNHLTKKQFGYNGKRLYSSCICDIGPLIEDPVFIKLKIINDVSIQIV
jgi:hypothetical protein